MRVGAVPGPRPATLAIGGAAFEAAGKSARGVGCPLGTVDVAAGFTLTAIDAPLAVAAAAVGLVREASFPVALDFESLSAAFASTQKQEKAEKPYYNPSQQRKGRTRKTRPQRAYLQEGPLPK